LTSLEARDMFSPVIYVSSPIKLCSFSSKVLEYSQDGVWLVTESYKACNDEEISLKKGQHVEVLVKTHGSSRWRVRVLNSDGTVPAEGWVPYTALRKTDDRENRRKRNSDISHSSSEGKRTVVCRECIILPPNDLSIRQASAERVFMKSRSATF
jgi:hypothetical protein